VQNVDENNRKVLSKMVEMRWIYLPHFISTGVYLFICTSSFLSKTF